MAVPDWSLAIPSDAELSHRDGWPLIDETNPHKHLAVRRHYRIQTPPSTLFQYGEPIAVFESPAEIEHAWEFGIERQIDVVVEHQTTIDILKNVAVDVPLPGAQIGFEIAVSQATTVRQAITETRRVTFRVTSKKPAGNAGTYYVLTCYRRVTKNVFLTLVDFLVVEHHPLRPLRRRTIVSPSAEPSVARGDWVKRNNVRREARITPEGQLVRLPAPFRQVSYWELAEDSSIVVTEEEKERLCQVERPYDVEVCPDFSSLPCNPRQLHASEKGLHQLANTAFRRRRA